MQKKVENYLVEVEKRRQTIIDLIHYLEALEKKTKYIPEPLIEGTSWLRRVLNFHPVCPLCEGEIENRFIYPAAPEIGIQWPDYFYWECTNCDYEKIIETGWPIKSLGDTQ